MTKISIGKDVELRREAEMQVERKGCVRGVKEVGYGPRRQSRHDQRMSVADVLIFRIFYRK